MIYFYRGGGGDGPSAPLDVEGCIPDDLIPVFSEYGRPTGESYVKCKANCAMKNYILYFILEELGLLLLCQSIYFNILRS